MNKRNSILVAGAVLLLATIGVVYGYSMNRNTAGNITSSSATATPQPPQKIDAHLSVNKTLRDVNFCGDTYTARQVMIDGVDVVQRIAELATKKFPTSNLAHKDLIAEDICNNANPVNSTGIIDVTWHAIFTGQSAIFKNESEIYPIIVDDNMFFIAIASGNIYVAGAFDGTPVGPLGKLK
jgi:hypothetical protein